MKPVAWYASRQVTIAPIGESPVAQSTICQFWLEWVRFPPLATSEVYTHKFCTKCYGSERS